MMGFIRLLIFIKTKIKKSFHEKEKMLTDKKEFS